MMEKSNDFSNKLYLEIHTTKSLTQKIKTIAYQNFAYIVLFKKLQENKLVLGILVKNGVFNYHLNSENQTSRIIQCCLRQ